LAELYFVAIDFETANNDRFSACQIGIVAFDRAGIEFEKKINIRPPSEYFLHSGIHGITWSDVYDQPSFEDVWPEIEGYFSSTDYLVAHNASFDKSVLEACCSYYKLANRNRRWLCTFRDVARRLWPNLQNHKLPTVCQALGISIVHHDGLSDARACAKIILAAYQKNPRWLEALGS